MNIQQQNGIISTINFSPFLENEEYKSLRKSLFDQAVIASNISPVNQIDVYDESILVFHSIQQALSFLYHVFHSVVKLERENNGGISLRSSICFGDYFVHQDQIYGDAVNLATKLTYSSRENEMLVCGIDSQVIEDFSRNHGDIACYARNSDENCVSISLLDQDSTCIKVDTRQFKFKFNDQSKEFDLERNRKIRVGRSNDSDIFIDSDRISRNHATITLNYDSLLFEDHSSNGTYLYFDDREVFVTRETIKLPCSNGHISCGYSLYANNGESTDVISFMLNDDNTVTREF